MPAVIRGILIVTAAVFGVSALLPAAGAWTHLRLGLWFPENPNFAPWQLLTSVFMHASMPHILFNMIALFSFGTPLELRWGGRRFLVFYLICGVGAAATHLVAQEVEFHLLWQKLNQAGYPDASLAAMLKFATLPGLEPSRAVAHAAENLYQIYHGPMVGASGAVYGILVAFGVLFPRVRLTLIFLPVPIEARFFIPGLIALDLFSGVTGFSIFGGGIAHFAHVGGALIGFLFMLGWRRKSSPFRA